MLTDPVATPHSVIDRPHRYDVVELQIDLADKRLTMRLRRGNEEVTLRFSGVRQLSMDEGYDGGDSGMEILDYSASGMESARVRVSSFEQDPALSFWASGVERVG